MHTRCQTYLEHPLRDGGGEGVRVRPLRPPLRVQLPRLYRKVGGAGGRWAAVEGAEVGHLWRTEGAGRKLVEAGGECPRVCDADEDVSQPDHARFNGLESREEQRDVGGP